jgi:transcriptional regulator with XRE-family HTH domain
MEVWMERIKELRAEKGLTQVRLAVAADMNPATLNRIEQGKANPNLKTLERLAAALDVEVGDFFPKVQRSSPEPSLFDDKGGEPGVTLEQLHYHGIPANASEVSILNQMIGASTELVEEEAVEWCRVYMLLGYVLAHDMLTEYEREMGLQTLHRELVDDELAIRM